MVKTRKKNYSFGKNISRKKNVSDITLSNMKTSKKKSAKKVVNHNLIRNGRVRKNSKILNKKKFATSTPIHSGIKSAKRINFSISKQFSNYLNSRKLILDANNSHIQNISKRNIHSISKVDRKQKMWPALRNSSTEIIRIESDTESENNSDDDVKILSWRKQESGLTNGIVSVVPTTSSRLKRKKVAKSTKVLGETIILNDTESFVDNILLTPVRQNQVQNLDLVNIVEGEQNKETVEDVIIINDSYIENRVPTVKKTKVSIGTQMTPIRKKNENDTVSSKQKEINENCIKHQFDRTESNNKFSLTSPELKNIREGTDPVELLTLPTKNIGNFRKRGLRLIVIDGSNVALGHSQGRFFSTRGLQICIDYFLKRGHTVKAFVPQFRLKRNQATLTNVLKDLGQKGHVVFTPAREVNGKMIVPYDDRFIVQCATEFEGVIVSNDNYRDLMSENYHWRKTIEKRLLMWTWVEDTIMFPLDPLGRYGPTLDRFLRFP